MIEFLYKAYRYYYYRSYLFTLRNWKNKSIASLATGIGVFFPVMANVSTVLIFCNLVFATKMPSKLEFFICMLVLAIIFVVINNIFIVRRFTGILEEFKYSKNYNLKYNLRGWLITFYYVGSYLLFSWLLLHGIEIRKKARAAENNIHQTDLRQESINKAKLDSLIKKPPPSLF